MMDTTKAAADRIKRLRVIYDNMRKEVAQSNLSESTKSMLETELRTSILLTESQFIRDGGSLL